LGNRTLRLIALPALSTGALRAADLTGTWQGTLTPQDGKELRDVFKISRDANATKCIFYTIDQSPPGFACSVTQAAG
jgi:hypothetical protein